MQPIAGQRIVRLTFDQITSAVADLVGTTAAEYVWTNHELPGLAERSFPPLESPREGSLVTDGVWQLGDAVAQSVGKFVLDNFVTITGCGLPPNDECTRAFIGRFAQKAFRRPLSGDELDNLMTVYAEAKAAGGTIEEATEHVVYAVLESPLFLYRTELGDETAPSMEVPLTAYETASLLSFFLTNGPPDAVLLGAAANGTIMQGSVLDEQIARLLTLPATKGNFQMAMLSYLGLPGLADIVIDPSPADFTTGLRDSMFHELELFLEDHLWDGSPLGALLVSRRSRVNLPLANLYGIAVAPSVPEFTEVTLPEERAGFLTMPGFLTAHARPDETAVTARGALVNALVACQANPPYVHPPEDPSVDPVPSESTTQRERADFRAETPVCAGCHSMFDGYGLALERFDIIGRYRTTDARGRPIDPSVTLPETAQGSVVSSAEELGRALSRPELWSTCLAEAFLRFAMAEPLGDVDGRCVAREVVRAQSVSGASTFPGLVSELASRAVTSRRREGP